MNDLKLNLKKTQCLLFKSTVKNNDTVKVHLLGNKVDIVDNVKFLGVQIDAVLNWKKELEVVTNTMSSACYALRSLRDELTIAHLRIVYFALIESRLRYSIKFWGNSYQYNINAAFVMQKRALRTMLRIKQTESCRDHFKKLHILTVPCLYILVLLSHFIKNIHKFETEEQRHIRIKTRRKDLPNFIQPKLNVVKHASRVQSVNMYNKLPVQFKNSMNPNEFKRKLKSLLLGKCYYSIEEFLKDNNSSN